MAIACPGCSLPMNQLSVDGHYGRTVGIDLCHACAAFWFDTIESLALSPGAILRLFAVIGERQGDRRPPSGVPTCPRCRRALTATSDMQRNVHFSYWRCRADHGRFITFAEFLREKNFVRPLSAAELDRLRAGVKTIRCSSCGAPIDLEHTSTCGYCRAPVSMLDAGQVEKVVAQLERAEAERRKVDPALPLRLMADRLHVERLFQGLERSPGLVEAGLAAVAELLASTD
jgi:Zn-finger nucleic acid-binding protein